MGIAGGDLNVGASGVVNFNSSAALNGNLYNAGTINIAAGQTVTVGGPSSIFNQAGGTLNVSGGLSFSGATCNLGGKLNGAVVLTGATPVLSAGASGTYVINNTGNKGTLNSSTISAGVNILFQPTVSSNFVYNFSSEFLYGNLTLVSADGCTNSFTGSSQFMYLYGTCTIAASGTPSGPTTITGYEIEARSGSTLNFNTSTVCNSFSIQRE